MPTYLIRFSDTVVENDPHIPEKPFFHPFALGVL